MPPGKPKRDKAKELFWRKAVARQVESGLSQNAFCERAGLNPNNFSWWKLEIKRREKEKPAKEIAVQNQPLFVPVANAQAGQQDAKATSAKPVAEIDISTGTVKIFAGIDRHTLHEIFAVFREVAY